MKTVVSIFQSIQLSLPATETQLGSMIWIVFGKSSMQRPRQRNCTESKGIGCRSIAERPP